MIETSELFTRANHLPVTKSLVVLVTQNFKSLVVLVSDIRFKLNEGTHKIWFNLWSGLKETLLVCDTCAIPPLGKFIVEMIVTFGSVITQTLDIK